MFPPPNILSSCLSVIPSASPQPLFHAQHGIEAAVNTSDGRLWVRIMAQAYNEPDDYERLRRAFER